MQYLEHLSPHRFCVSCCSLLLFAVVCLLILFSVRLLTVSVPPTAVESSPTAGRFVQRPPSPPRRSRGLKDLKDGNISLAGSRRLRSPSPARLWVPTRGAPRTYRRMGILVASEDTRQSSPQAPLVLPLLGRRTSPRSHQWNYITYNDTRIPIRLAIWDAEKGRDCTKKRGCSEFSDQGQTVYVQPYGTYVVDMDESEPFRNDLIY